MVICKPEIRPKVDRNIKYIEGLAALGKLPTLFDNVLVMDTEEFKRLYR